MAKKEIVEDCLTREEMISNLSENRAFISELIYTHALTNKGRITSNSDKPEHNGRIAERFFGESRGLSETAILEIKRKCGIRKSYKEEGLKPLFSLMTFAKQLAKYDNEKIRREIEKKLDQIINSSSATKANSTTNLVTDNSTSPSSQINPLQSSQIDADLYLLLLQKYVRENIIN